MKTRFAIAGIIVLALAATLAAEPRPIIVVYDFTSVFDGGKTGEWLAEMVRGHAVRSGRYVGNPKITVDEVLAAKDFHPNASTAPDELAKFTRVAFEGDLFIYGSVEKGEQGFHLLFRVYRALGDGKAEKVVDETKDCAEKQIISLAVDELMNEIAGVKDAPTEWKGLAADLREWSKELTTLAADGKCAMPDWLKSERVQQDKVVNRLRNVTTRSNFDFASKALIDYLEMAVDAGRDLVKELSTAETNQAARAMAGKCARLADGLAKSIDAWLDDASAEARWKDGKNLVMNGDFEAGQKDPANWEPLKEHMSWTADPDGKTGKCVKFDVPEAIAYVEGMLFYSQSFTVEPGATYRIRWRFRTEGPAVKLWIKGYDHFPKAFGFEEQDREVWRSRKDPQYHAGLHEYQLNQWTEYGHDFVPWVSGKVDDHTGRFVPSAPQPRYAKLMLYAYEKPGIVYWDDIVVKKIKDAPIWPVVETK